MDIGDFLSPSKSLANRRKHLQEKVAKADRFEPKYNVGLDDVLVQERINEELINKKKKVVTKTYLRIFTDNFFSFFNILIFGLGILTAIAQKWNQLMFLGVIICNCAIGIIQDLRARKLVDKLSIINKMRSTVVRGGTEKSILATELVLDDVIILKNGDQVPADCVLLKGNVSVNEAMLTGEPDSIKKKQGDTILSGTYVSSGTCYARVNQIGMLNAAEEIQAKASAFNKPKSEILKSLTFLFRIIGIIVVVVGALSIISYWYISPEDFSWATFAGAPNDNNSGYIGSFVGTLVAMIPAGLYLLTSVALSVGVITLSKKRCLVQELYSIEMLARIDTLCLDKTGTITDGTMIFNDYIKVDRKFSEEEAGQILRSLISGTKDESYTTKAIMDKFSKYVNIEAKDAVPFSSETKCSAAYFEKYGTYILGAFGYINISNKIAVEKIVKDYSKKGYRCLLLCKSKKRIMGDKIPTDSTCIGIIVLEDHIRDTAAATLKWFAENGVDVKVISGDDPLTVSEIANKVGIKNSDKYINLEGMSFEEVKQIATKYTIFGRVSPEQKEALVISLKENGKTVGMTGDGVNDILALKRSDCSIAMNSGSDAAKNVSHLVLLDSDFSVLPSVVAEGRRVINNLQRTSALFFSKTVFTMLTSLLFVILTFCLKDPNMKFPLQTSNYYVWEIAVIGVGGTFLSLEPNSTQIKGHFLPNAFRNSLPISIAMFFSILGMFIVYTIDLKLGGHVILGLNFVDSQYSTLQTFQAMCSLALVAIGFASLFKVCFPFSKYRIVVFSGLIVLTIITLFITFNIPPILNPLKYSSFGAEWFAFEIISMGVIDWLWTIVFVVFGIILYFCIDKIFNKFNMERKLFFLRSNTK